MKLSMILYIQRYMRMLTNLLYQGFSYTNKLIRSCSKEGYLTDF